MSRRKARHQPPSGRASSVMARHAMTEPNGHMMRCAPTTYEALREVDYYPKVTGKIMYPSRSAARKAGRFLTNVGLYALRVHVCPRWEHHYTDVEHYHLTSGSSWAGGR